ncbi:MBL fold metallo-hydrolase RNA specificity domain-containing protein [Streptomyces sp. NPDC059122]|uniref:MBL fold metallo-hydrolase RNA specificity domain-containing protein n=1 Tax=Streptomyces sp. NPDC059122 TaxID=3346732 RepID=UPI0036777436
MTVEFGEYLPVGAEVANVPHFSAHADAAQIVDRLRAASPPHTTYLVQGEPDASFALRDRIARELGWCHEQERTSWSAEHRANLSTRSPNPAGAAGRPAMGRRGGGGVGQEYAHSFVQP